MDCPYLKYFSALHEQPTAIKIVTNDVDITIETEKPQQLKNLLLDMDGNNTIGTLSKKYHYDEKEIRDLLFHLIDANVVKMENIPSSNTVDPQNFAKMCREIFPKWKRDVFTLDFWHDLTTGILSRSAFAGWLLENFYFIEGATKRLSLVTMAANENKQIRALFSQHFIEEYNHHMFFMKALKRLGFTKKQVLNHQPLPSTIAIINHMRECGRRDIISYATCSAFLESTGGDRKEGMVFYNSLIQYYDKENKGIVQPLIEHAYLDEEYGHNDWLEKVCICISTLEKERANDAIKSAEILVETLKLWTHDIQAHYRNISFNEIINPFHYR
ncbi:iron-containing redox enzyme family protein [Xenorhabdus anantnagensis]|uniref:Iron-containing redox enzyme family protein n=1 Tax=Xenorhabdus anantnagensis TaxID=3025875 RepID=A0ABT5LWI6_9GAMM|nr:iron-containing redox enzyme family protein [Xenorhabdus anantnagensis]MDC9598815.1 iron-containing redox enzyme family protein [Xenorhabdus anantnagensis]